MKCVNAGHAMSLEVRSTEQSLFIVCNTDTARESAAEAQEKWQQRNTVDVSSQELKSRKQCITWRNAVYIDTDLTVFKRNFSRT